VVFSTGPYAYIKLAEGCNHTCAFCTIPGIRGKRRSRPLRQIVAEAEKLLARGFFELNLIAQDVTAYGTDSGGKERLPELLHALGRIGGDFWIRLLYAYPTGVTPELLETMASVRQVCHYLDVPVQHSHPAVLRAMRRAETIRAVAQLPEKIRAFMPDAVLRTTCLLGHPGETAARFSHLLDYLERGAFDHVGAFVFSPEAGTAAAAMRPRPRRITAERRCAELLAAQRTRIIAKRAGLTGKKETVLLESRLDNNRWRARPRWMAPEVDGTVFVKGVPKQLQPGKFVAAEYSAVQEYDMLARFAKKL
jgi:ribosomal protein S12 methylthiotransferase